MTDAATVRRHLGELAALSDKTEKAERKILDDATRMLADVEGKMSAAASRALQSDKGGDEYTELVAERGRLQQVISRAKAVLSA